MHDPTMVTIPAYGPVTTRALSPQYAEYLFTDANRLGGSTTLTRDDDTEVILRHSLKPTRHPNTVASHLVTHYTGTEQPVTGLAAVVAADGGDLVPVPQSVIDTVHTLANRQGPADTTLTLPAQAINATAATAKAMLAARPGHLPGEDPYTEITAAIGELLSYAAVLCGYRDHTTIGTILTKVIGAVADQARDDMAAIALPGERDHTAPGFGQEAAWTIGELITEAQRRQYADPPTRGFALLCDAILDHMLNAPFASLDSRPNSGTLADLGGRLAALIAEASAELGPDGPLDMLCWAIDRPVKQADHDQR